MSVKIYAFADEANSRLEGQIEAMKRNSLDGLEIRQVNGKNVTKLTLDEARGIKKQLDDAGLSVWSIGSPIGKIRITDDFAPHAEVFRHTLEVADILEAPCMRIFSFFIPEGEDAADYKNEVMDRLGRLCELSAGSKIKLCHENEKGIYGDTAARCKEILDALPSLYGVFDPANFIQCGENTTAAWELLKDRVYYLHIKDALENKSVVPAGMGIGNLPFILGDYISRGGVAVSLEPHLKVFDGLASLEREGERSVVDDCSYPTKDAAFDAACNALRRII